MIPWLVASIFVALLVKSWSRAHNLRIQALACPHSARQKIEHLFLVTEEPGERHGLKLAMDLIDAEEDLDPDSGDYGAAIAVLSRHAHRTGDERAAMLETFAAATNCPEYAGLVEASVSHILREGT